MTKKDQEYIEELELKKSNLIADRTRLNQEVNKLNRKVAKLELQKDAILAALVNFQECIRQQHTKILEYEANSFIKDNVAIAGRESK